MSAARYHQAEYRAKQAEEKLEKARENLPVKRHVHLEKQYDADSGKVRHRLRFEEEVQPEYGKPSLPAQAAHEARQTARFTQNVLNESGKIARIVAQYASAHKSVFLVAALLVLIVTLFSAGLTSCTAMLSGIQSSYLSVTYLSNEEDICQSDLYFTELETDLQLDIKQTEVNFPDYDEYRYNMGRSVTIPMSC